MNTANPDKHIRKEIYDRLHNSEVNTLTFKCYDTNVTSANDDQYFLIGTQLNQPLNTKCNRGWLNSTEIQVVVRTKKNTGSRVLLDDAVDHVLTELDSFSLPVLSGMKVSLSEISIENELVEDTQSEIFYTKILRIETTIN
tara:strand:+ start:32610 stop:33032 length:423 start_codon:yes stop_codon:yes gene_type:complete